MTWIKLEGADDYIAICAANLTKKLETESFFAKKRAFCIYITDFFAIYIRYESELSELSLK